MDQLKHKSLPLLLSITVFIFACIIVMGITERIRHYEERLLSYRLAGQLNVIEENLRLEWQNYLRNFKAFVKRENNQPIINYQQWNYNSSLTIDKSDFTDSMHWLKNSGIWISRTRNPTNTIDVLKIDVFKFIDNPQRTLSLLVNYDEEYFIVTASNKNPRGSGSRGYNISAFNLKHWLNNIQLSTWMEDYQFTLGINNYSPQTPYAKQMIVRLNEADLELTLQISPSANLISEYFTSPLRLIQLIGLAFSVLLAWSIYLFSSYRRLFKNYQDTIKKLELEVELRKNADYQTTKFNHKISESNQKLADANRELEYANESINRFLATASHEFRTPLGVIIGFSRRIQKRYNELSQQEIQDLIRKIINASTHLKNLTTGFEVISQHELGNTNISASSISVSELLDSVATMMEPIAADNDLSLVIEKPEKDFKLNQDETKLKQILINLVNNAIKYTPSGHVTLTAVAKQNDHTEFSVTDTGIGIKSSDKQKIFEEFSRVHDKNQIAAEGVGLGLTITKHLVYVLNGKVDVTSKMDQGSTFSVTIPTNFSAKAAN